MRNFRPRAARGCLRAEEGEEEGKSFRKKKKQKLDKKPPSLGEGPRGCAGLHLCVDHTVGSEGRASREACSQGHLLPLESVALAK